MDMAVSKGLTTSNFDRELVFTNFTSILSPLFFIYFLHDAFFAHLFIYYRIHLHKIEYKRHDFMLGSLM